MFFVEKNDAYYICFKICNAIFSTKSEGQKWLGILPIKQLSWDTFSLVIWIIIIRYAWVESWGLSSQTNEII